MKRRTFITGSAALAAGLQSPVSAAVTRSPRLTIIQSRRPATGWRLGGKDLNRYLARAGVRTDIRGISGPRDLPGGTLLVLVDPQDWAMARLRAQYPGQTRSKAPESFSISSFDRQGGQGGRIYFLEAWDPVGEQFACYEFLERYAGIRFLHPDFEHVPQFAGDSEPINTGLVEPGFRYRGLYPWHYNYDSRGLTTFCDINAHFVAKDWPWFARLGDWLIKNKQNTFFWFDDVFDVDPITPRFPAALKQHWRERGLRQVLGMGWPTNEGRPRGGKWEALTCVDAQGKSIEDAEWRKAICPQVPEYAALREQNVAKVDFRAPEAIGALIGNAENSWAAHQASTCVRHADVPADVLMKRDLDYAWASMAARGAGNLPVGFVISTHSADDDSPFSSGSILESLPKNGLVSMHIYQQDQWTNFSDILTRIRKRNEREKASVKALPIAEVAFLCNYDIPLFRPSIISRREAHFRSLPRLDALGHLATLNTTQYLYWLKSYQLMRWQWRTPAASWGDEMGALGGDLFGPQNEAVFKDLVGRMAALDLLKPASAGPDLLRSSKELTRIQEWARYTPKRHSDEFGFFLWSKDHDPGLLRDAEENVAATLQLNERLAQSGGQLYASQFFDVMALTAHYHAIRIHIGKADHAIAAALKLSGTERGRQIRIAVEELARAKTSRVSYDRHFGKLVPATGAGARADIQRDFVLNPSSAFIDSRIAALEQAMSGRSAPLGIFDEVKG